MRRALTAFLLFDCSTAVSDEPIAEPIPFAGGPVLLFHEICRETCTSADTSGVSRVGFDRMLQSFSAAGYESIDCTHHGRCRER